MEKELEVKQEFIDKVNKSKDENGIITKTMEILDVDKRNRSHRFYPIEVVEKWKSHEDIINGPGIDVEYALEDQDIDNEFITKALSCASVTGFKIKGTILSADVKFKKNELTKNLYDGKLDLDFITLVPKGKGSVKNQKVQDDYELFGFNLAYLDESSFHEDKKEKEAANA